MLIVDVRVPALDTIFDFSLSEDTPIGILLEEMVELVCRREKLMEAQDSGLYVLCCMNSGQILDGKKTLKDYGIETGHQLMIL